MLWPCEGHTKRTKLLCLNFTGQRGLSVTLRGTRGFWSVKARSVLSWISGSLTLRTLWWSSKDKINFVLLQWTVFFKGIEFIFNHSWVWAADTGAGWRPLSSLEDTAGAAEKDVYFTHVLKRLGFLFMLGQQGRAGPSAGTLFKQHSAHMNERALSVSRKRKGVSEMTKNSPLKI